LQIEANNIQCYLPSRKAQFKRLASRDYDPWAAGVDCKAVSLTAVHSPRESTTSEAYDMGECLPPPVAPERKVASGRK